MNKLEKDIQDRFINAQSLEGIDKEELWMSISEARLGQGESRKKRRPIFFFWTMIGVLGIFSSIAVYHTTDNIPEEYTSLLETTKESTTDSLNHITEVLSLSSKPSTLGIEAEKQASVKPHLKVEETPEILAVIDDAKVEKKHKNETAKKVLQMPIAEEVNVEIVNAEVHKNTKNSRLDELFTKAQIDLTSEIGYDVMIVPETTKEWHNIRLGATEGLLNILQLKVDYLNEETHPALPISEVIRKQNRNRIPFKVYAGTNLLRDKFSEKGANKTLVDSLNSSLTLEPGLSVGAALRLKKWQNWSLNMGIEYHKFNQRFDKVLITDTLVLAGENGQTLFDAVNVRTIRHYNSLQVLTVPVELEISKKFHRIESGIGLGASYSFVVDQAGRKLVNEDQVAAFSTERKQYANYISLRMTPFVGYRLNEHMILNVNASLSYQGHDKSEFISITNNSLTIVPSVGVSFNY